MTAADLQHWLNAHGQSIAVDGNPGPQTRAAILAAFTNRAASEISDGDIAILASRLGCTVKQIKAVARVESGGSAFDAMGRPKILFERHYFWKITEGRHGKTSFSNPQGGGYNESSWDKLTRAACLDPAAAFASASWGRFQIMGAHWKLLGYPSSLEMAYSTVISEAAHYEMLARFIEKNDMKSALAALSVHPSDNEPFASRYNGPNFKKFRYDEKLAVAMA